MQATIGPPEYTPEQPAIAPANQQANEKRASYQPAHATTDDTTNVETLQAACGSPDIPPFDATHFRSQ
jgi:hypothetical protein